MSWVKENPKKLEQVKEFCDQICDQIPWGFSREKQNREKALARALLFSALYQGIENLELLQIFKMIDQFKIKPFDLPEPRKEELLSVLNKSSVGLRWELAAKFPGILWSVGEFTRSNSLEDMLANATRTQILDHLKTNIFYMGKLSDRPVKASAFLSIARLFLSTDVQQEKLMPSQSNYFSHWSEGARRYLFEIGPLKGSWLRGRNFVRGSKYLSGFCLLLNSNFPEKIEWGLSIFQQKLNNELQCRALLKGCGNCPLCNECSEFVQP